jgi:sterol desaturase/sphingolipid hydroxylase (fatty acid hydroxylase superfamily)
MTSIEAAGGISGQPKDTRGALDGVAVRIIIGFAAYLGVVALAWMAIVHLTPDALSLHIAGHALSVTRLHHHLQNLGMDLAVISPGFLVAEMAVTGWTQSSLRRLSVMSTPSSRSDLMFYLLWESRLINFAIVAMTFGVGLISGDWLHDKIAAVTGVSVTLAAWPIWIQLPLLFVVFSFFDYWNHRLDHWHYFWPLHRYHHSADDFCVFTASRVHPALFTGVISGVIPPLILGASPQAMVDLILAMMMLRYVIHSRIDSNFGWIGRWVFQSPNHHRLHHVLDITHNKVGHFSLAPIWDHLFGTWRGEADQSLVIGVDADYRHGAWVWPDLWRDYADFWRRIGRGLTGRPRLPEPTSTRP